MQHKHTNLAKIIFNEAQRKLVLLHAAKEQVYTAACLHHTGGFFIHTAARNCHNYI